MVGVSLNSLPFQTSVLPIHQWQGKSGRWYPHSIVTQKQQLFDCMAIYVMVRRNSDFSVTPLYIGKADSLRTRFMSHEKVEPAFRLGANELHVHLLAQSESELLATEKDLIEGQNPELNIQHNSGRRSFDDLLSAFAEQERKSRASMDWLPRLSSSQPKETEYSDLAAVLAKLK